MNLSDGKGWRHRYRCYRSYGHTRFTAASLAVGVWTHMAVGVALGVAVILLTTCAY